MKHGILHPPIALLFLFAFAPCLAAGNDGPFFHLSAASPSNPAAPAERPQRTHCRNRFFLHF